MLVLVDTSVWLAHWRAGLPAMSQLLKTQDVVTHSVVMGELAVGNLRDRSRTLADLHALIGAVECPAKETLDFLESHHLYGLGLSWGDVQILAAAQFNSVFVWTLDQRLKLAAKSFKLDWSP